MPMLRQTATLQIKLEGAEGQGWVLQHISAGELGLVYSSGLENLTRLGLDPSY